MRSVEISCLTDRVSQVWHLFEKSYWGAFKSPLSSKETYKCFLALFDAVVAIWVGLLLWAPDVQDRVVKLPLEPYKTICSIKSMR